MLITFLDYLLDYLFQIIYLRKIARNQGDSGPISLNQHEHTLCIRAQTSRSDYAGDPEMAQKEYAWDLEMAQNSNSSVRTAQGTPVCCKFPLRK